MEGDQSMKTGVISTISVVGGAVIGIIGTSKVFKNSIADRQKMSDKHLALFEMMNQWVRAKQKGKRIDSYLVAKGYSKIAIYGLGFVGETLVEELRDSKVIAVYGIDKNAESICSDIDIFSADDELPKVDAVVVTAITFFREIEEKLSQKLDCPIISLEDILYEI